MQVWCVNLAVIISRYDTLLAAGSHSPPYTLTPLWAAGKFPVSATPALHMLQVCCHRIMVFHRYIIDISTYFCVGIIIALSYISRIHHYCLKLA